MVCPICTGYMLDHRDLKDWKRCSCGYCAKKELVDVKVSIDIEKPVLGIRRCVNDACNEPHEYVNSMRYCHQRSVK